MCGRYTITLELIQLLKRYLIEEDFDLQHGPRYNVAPMQMIPAVINDGVKNRIGMLRWGLLPSWSKADNMGAKMINARAETIAEKPSFKGLLARKRCLLPADGFYEWQAQSGKKQPYRITLKGQKIFSFAGLYDTWIAPDGKKISTCTIITIEPNELMRDIHNRMPAILRREDEAQWLDRSTSNGVLDLLRPYESTEMTAYPVGDAVGSVRNDSPELILPRGT